MKLWIDEDLTPRLVDPAHAHGYEATSNRDRGLLGATDAALYEIVVDGDYVFVTNNEQDFRRLCRGHDLHPGLIVLAERIRVEQVAMFERVLDYVEQHAARAGEAPGSWMVNRVVEVDPTTEVCRDHPLP
jgi:predicted nuclease of predicted toxin-antitoxin system